MIAVAIAQGNLDRSRNRDLDRAPMKALEIAVLQRRLSGQDREALGDRAHLALDGHGGGARHFERGVLETTSF